MLHFDKVFRLSSTIGLTLDVKYKYVCILPKLQTINIFLRSYIEIINLIFFRINPMIS